MADSDLLQRIPLFSRLSTDDLRRVAEIANRETFPHGSHLADVGRPGTALYYIVSGEAVVYAVGPRRRTRPVGYLRPGMYFGTTSLLLGEPHDATVVATTDVSALVLDRGDLDQLEEQIPNLQQQLVMPDPIRAKLRYKRFSWLDPTEVVVYFGQRHWFVFARAIFLPTLGVLALAVMLLFLAKTFGVGTSGLAIILGLVALIYVPIVLWYVVDWRNDYFLVTTQRVIHRELVVYQYEARHEAPLTRVQDVRVKKSAWGGLLGFGDVYIETAAETRLGRITFDHIPDPETARDTIMQQLNRAEVYSKSLARDSMRHELRRQLGWATTRELEEQGQSRDLPRPAQIEPRRGWLSRLGALRLLPPLRLEEGDRITWRKHWVFLVRKIAKPMLAAGIWFVILIACLTGQIPFVSSPPSLGVVLGLFLSGFAVGFWLWWEVVDWENDIYVVSDTVLIDVEKKPLFFSEERRETTLDRVQDVNMVIPNAFASIMGYGDVNIQTAGEEGEFTFTHVPAPRDVQRTIMSRVARFRERREQSEALQRRHEMADWFTVYEEMRRQRESPERGTPAGATPRATPS